MASTEKAVVLHGEDNVATALADLEAGTSLTLEVEGKAVTVSLKARIPFGHKFSLSDIKKGAPVMKYGEAIGVATVDINQGDYVHIHNVASARGSGAAPGGAR